MSRSPFARWPTHGESRFLQTIVSEPSFRRGIASIVDLRGQRFVVNERGTGIHGKTTSVALSADRKRIAADSAAVKPR